MKKSLPVALLGLAALLYVVMLPITLIVGAAFILRDDLVRRDAIFFMVGAVVGAVGMVMVAGVLG